MQMRSWQGWPWWLVHIFPASEAVEPASSLQIQPHLSSTNCCPHQGVKRLPGLQHSQRFGEILIHSHNPLIQGLKLNIFFYKKWNPIRNACEIIKAGQNWQTELSRKQRKLLILTNASAHFLHDYGFRQIPFLKFSLVLSMNYGSPQGERESE